MDIFVPKKSVILRRLCVVVAALTLIILIGFESYGGGMYESSSGLCLAVAGLAVIVSSVLVREARKFIFVSVGCLFALLGLGYEVWGLLDDLAAGAIEIDRSLFGFFVLIIWVVVVSILFAGFLVGLCSMFRRSNEEKVDSTFT